MATNSEEPSPKRSRFVHSIELDLAKYNPWVHDLRDEELVKIFELGVFVKESVTMTVDFNQKHMEELLASKMEPIHKSVAEIEGQVKLQVLNVQQKVTQDVGSNIESMTSHVQDLTKKVSDHMLGITKEVSTVANKVPPLDSLNQTISQSAESVKTQLTQYLHGLEQRVLGQIQPAIADCQTRLTGLSSSLERPSNKGTRGERTVLNILKEHLPRFNFTDVSLQAGKGDINGVSPRGNNVLIEVKNHKNPVPRDDIERFENDLANSPDCKVGILFSWESTIAQRSKNGKFEVNVGNNQSQYLIYVPNAGREESVIVWSVLMADELAENIGELGETKTRGLKRIYDKFSENITNSKNCQTNLEALETCVKNLKDSMIPILQTVDNAKKEMNKLLH